MRVLVLGCGADSAGGVSSAATEALLALKAGGAEVVLLDSNPATLATDPDVAHRTYLEPVTLEAAVRILALEQPDAVIATLGGETALALAKQLPAAMLLGVTHDGLEKAGRLNAQVSLAALQGWRQAELLVLADAKGAAEVAGTIELLEPVGVPAQDSLAVTPARTFSPGLLQKMEALALATARDVSMQGLCAVRLAVHPNDGRIARVELSLALPSHTSLVTRASGRHLAAEAARLLLGQPLEKQGTRNGRYVRCVPIAMTSPMLSAPPSNRGARTAPLEQAGRVRDGGQGARGWPSHRRAGSSRRGRAVDQHPRRGREERRGQLRAAARGGRARGAVLHDRRGGAAGGGGARGAGRGGTAISAAPGLAFEFEEVGSAK